MTVSLGMMPLSRALSDIREECQRGDTALQQLQTKVCSHGVDMKRLPLFVYRPKSSAQAIRLSVRDHHVGDSPYTNAWQLSMQANERATTPPGSLAHHQGRRRGGRISGGCDGQDVQPGLPCPCAGRRARLSFSVFRRRARCCQCLAWKRLAVTACRMQACIHELLCSN